MAFQKGHIVNLGRKHSENAKNKMSKSSPKFWLGKKQSEETKEKISKALMGKNNPFYGKTHTKKVRDNISLAQTTHGMTNTRMFKIWDGMLQRCNNKNAPNYYLYGGRGIKVCSRWSKFEHFYEDMKKGYLDNLTLDRVNNDGNYSVDNCRWATRKEQANNKRNNRFIEYKGIRDTAANWARFFGISSGVLWNRLYFLKWSIEEAFFTPVRGRRVQF